MNMTVLRTNLHTWLVCISLEWKSRLPHLLHMHVFLYNVVLIVEGNTVYQSSCGYRRSHFRLPLIHIIYGSLNPFRLTGGV